MSKPSNDPKRMIKWNLGLTLVWNGDVCNCSALILTSVSLIIVSSNRLPALKQHWHRQRRRPCFGCPLHLSRVSMTHRRLSPSKRRRSIHRREDCSMAPAKKARVRFRLTSDSQSAHTAAVNFSHCRRRIDVFEAIVSNSIEDTNANKCTKGQRNKRTEESLLVHYCLKMWHMAIFYDFSADKI